ncbi:putative nuclease HARBI1 isoform X1 [Aphis gossypii]|nr:putative nuclease HARBI1 isoform X1 [Aphis gossypii]
MNVPSTSRGLSIERKVIIALRFFAAGSYQMDVGENRHASVSQPSVSRIIEEVTNAFSNPAIFNKFVHFPRNFSELDDVRTRFFSKYGLQGVVGVIDCTHIAITPPKKNDELYPEHIYVNRKGYHSINTQLICDVNLRILNVSARWPGSTHDSHIWNESHVKTFMTSLHDRGFTSYFLLGDSGYALRPWLLTPFLNVEANTPEYRFNEVFCRARSTIERCNGVLKMRFRCLLKDRTLHYSPNKASKIVLACVVLHNLCIEENVPLINEEVEDDDFGIYQAVDNEEMSQSRQNPELVAGLRFRQNIVNRLFTN